MDNTALVRRSDAGKARRDKGLVRSIPVSAKIAIRVLLDQPKEDLQAAAQVAGITTELLRRYLNRSDVQGYWREQKRIAWAIAASGNAAALRDVRDHSGNAVARVNAARALELGMHEMDDPGYTSRNTVPAAGITIVIETPGATAKVLPPPIEHEPVPGVHAWPSTD